MYSGRMTYRNNVPDKIRELYTEQHRSIAWLSENSGIADKTLRRKLKAPDKFNLGELSAVATALGTELEELVKAA